ncbi:hypothetical protein NUU61_006387 [Penicillium alfredii]|uniref:DUF1754-domain-containing protein n=1 Tax=Penicillium alfredii TaxID=1506179 RepID=A0A9W9K474_9EURO|nr:uncharacterized protein NUU61_006387 [Penicillium alfredii]KAJ5091517.1 hypothetical protein NUU61_006387 [Penicillium alfredii]
MAPDEYSGGGGKLKLKGSRVSEGRVEKKKNKKKEKSQKKAEQAEQAQQGDRPETSLTPRDGDDDGDRERDGISPGNAGGAAKTETEKKYEETRRKRLYERLQRDGIKTHKERVEELNKYLSRLSEHHDMPKIGPG